MLYPSGGCLVGAVYCSPLYSMGKDKYRMHNLGSYMYHKELPAAILSKKKLLFDDKCEIKGLIISMNILDSNLKPIGINYLKLGLVHFNMFKKFEYLLSSSERISITHQANLEVNRLKSFVNDRSKFDDNEYFKKFLFEITHSHILGYIYFEAIYNYITEKQDCEISSEYKKKYKEVYNWNAKNLMFKTNPDFASSFRLKDFKSDIHLIYKYIKEGEFISKLDSVVFLKEIRELIDSYIDLFLKGNKYDHMRGHIYHRLIRKDERYEDFYLYFDVYKALEIWNYWAKKNGLLPYNSINKKGEVGINPALMLKEKLSYEVFEAINFKEEDNITTLEKGDKIDIKISTRMIDPLGSLLRSGQYPQKNKK